MSEPDAAASGSASRWREDLSLAIYRLAWTMATPLVMGYLLWRSRRQPAYRAHWGERWAVGQSLRDGFDDEAPIWIHAVSVGETRAAQPLIEALLEADPRCRILLTHMTPTGRETGAQLYAERWPQRIRQAYLPYDLGWAMARFLARWRPRLGILMETELWPGLCREAVRAGVPLVLANARLSARSLRKGLRWRALITPALRSLALVLAQTEADAARLRQLGCADPRVTGNLKFDLAPSESALALGHGWRATLGSRRVVLFASSRDGEEALVLQAWGRAGGLRGDGPALLVVPRHPQRFDDVARLLGGAGSPLARRSQHWPDPAAALWLGDSMGEMGAYYALADVVIIGGSLLPFGAQNLIEACAVGVAVIVGPHTYNFEQATIEAIDAGAACRVPDASAAVQRALELLADDAARTTMGEAGQRFARAHRGATERTVAALAPWLDAANDSRKRTPGGAPGGLRA